MTVFAADVRAELRRLFASPRAELGVLLVNAVLVLVGWVVLPAGARDWLFDQVPGPFAVVVVLETWLMSDVTSTNILGHDIRGASEALRRPAGIRYLLWVKTAALTALIGLPCLATGLVVAGVKNDLPEALAFAPIFVAIPAGVIALVSVVGIALPYRPRRLVWRWNRRGRLHENVRWVAALLIPYWLVGVVTSALVVPAFVLASWLLGDPGPGGNGSGPPNSTVAVAALLTTVFSLTLYGVAPVAWERVAARCAPRLSAYLADADAG